MRLEYIIFLLIKGWKNIYSLAKKKLEKKLVFAEKGQKIAFWFLWSPCKIQLKSKIKKKKLFKAVLSDQQCTFFFLTQQWWTTFNINFLVIFVRETHKSFLKKLNLILYMETDQNLIIYLQNYPQKLSEIGNGFN